MNIGTERSASRNSLFLHPIRRINRPEQAGLHPVNETRVVKFMPPQAVTRLKKGAGLQYLNFFVL